MPIVLAVFIIAAVSLILNVRRQEVPYVERLETNDEATPSTQIRKDILDQISFSYCPLEVNPKVQIHDNFTNKEQIEVKIPDIVSLLHQTQSDSPESETSTPYRDSGELISEENTSTSVPNISSQASSLPTVLATSSVENEGQIPELKFELQLAYCVIPLSAGGIIGVLSGFPGNEKATLPHEVLFKAYTWLTYASFIFGVALFLLAHFRPNIQALVIIARFTMWVTVCSITYALGFATCVLLLMNTVVVALVMVVPLLLLAVIVILKCFNTKN